MVFPRMERWSSVCGFRPLTVSLTDFKCVFMLMSTPVKVVFVVSMNVFVKKRRSAGSFNYHEEEEEEEEDEDLLSGCGCDEKHTSKFESKCTRTITFAKRT